VRRKKVTRSRASRCRPFPRCRCIITVLYCTMPHAVPSFSIMFQSSSATPCTVPSTVNNIGWGSMSFVLYFSLLVHESNTLYLTIK